MLYRNGYCFWWFGFFLYSDIGGQPGRVLLFIALQAEVINTKQTTQIYNLFTTLVRKNQWHLWHEQACIKNSEVRSPQRNKIKFKFQFIKITEISLKSPQDHSFSIPTQCNQAWRAQKALRLSKSQVRSTSTKAPLRYEAQLEEEGRLLNDDVHKRQKRRKL